MEEWERFKVGTSEYQTDWEPFNCTSFKTVSHSSHVAPALDIINGGEIRPSLVYDKSKLNTQRILVCWLSPNYWVNGSRYGNIDFQFNFAQLIKGRNYYWVEAIEDYRPPALRILITDIYRDYNPPNSEYAQFKRYDPTLGNGPWWFNTSDGKHYFNGDYCLEFMVESTIPLTMLQSLQFIAHSRQYCAMNRNAPQRCSEFGLWHQGGAEKFLTRAAAMGVQLTQLIKDDESAKATIKAAVINFIYSSSDESAGEITADSPLAVPLARAAMSAYTYGRSEEASSLAGLFRDRKEYYNATKKIMTEITGITDWR